jgi:anti-sigma regulatory factor (Ser/Thr protein kinase)
MLEEKQKIAHVLSELVSYALDCEPQKVTIAIEDLEDVIQVTVEDHGARRDLNECRQAERSLNTSTRNELRDYYSGLAGEEHLGRCTLRIVGMLVDGGSVEQIEGATRITVWWKQT